MSTETTAILLAGLALVFYCWILMRIVRRLKVPSCPTYTDTKPSVTQCCTQPACRAPISAYHNFCGRCGTRLYDPLGPSLRAQTEHERIQMQMMRMQSEQHAWLNQQMGMQNQLAGLTGMAGLGQDRGQNYLNYLGLGGSGLP